jgi:hypothetical protein
MGKKRKTPMAIKAKNTLEVIITLLFLLFSIFLIGLACMGIPNEAANGEKLVIKEKSNNVNYNK